MIQKIENTNEIICEPVSDLELLERNPLKNPEKGDTFFCYPKGGPKIKIIVIELIYAGYSNITDSPIWELKVAKNGKKFCYSIDEYKSIVYSIPTNYIVFSKTEI